MSKLVMTVGIPASGKSCFAEREREKGAVVISSDAIREELYGDVNDQKHNAEVFDTMKKRTVAALRNGDYVVYDATNLNAKRRINFLKELRREVKEFEAFCAVFVTPYDECCKRNKDRERTVPDYVMERMYKNFQPPFYEEGWDIIVALNSTILDCKDLAEMMRTAIDTPHDNPHHKETIGEHMLLAREIARERGESSQIVEAALLHDIGKPFCKVFHNMKGEPTEYAHYYNHSNVGAYLYYQTLFGLLIDKEAETAALIGYHMEHYAGEGRLSNMKKVFSEDFMKKLEILNEIDRAATITKE